MFGFRLPGFKNEYRLESDFFELEPQEVLMDQYTDYNRETSIGESRIEVPLSRKILLGIYGLFLLGSAVFIGKSFGFQVLEHEEMALAAQDNLMRTTPIFAERGIIYDKEMSQLVHNALTFDLICDKRDIAADREGRETMMVQLANIVGRPIEELGEDFDKTSKAQFVAKEHLSHDQLVLWEAKKNEVGACDVQENVARLYEEGPFGHLLGYIAKISEDELKAASVSYIGENVGKMGIEKQYDSVLRGVSGETIEERDSFGDIIDQRVEREPQQGNGIVLHIDADLQKKMAESLQRVMADTGTKAGAVVALDPNTGGVRGLVSVPGFDNNIFAKELTSQYWQDLQQDPLAPLFNRAIAGTYPTGSVIKPLVGLAALEEGIITPTTIVHSPAEICIRNRYSQQDECFRDWTYHGDSDIRRAIAESVNTFFYKVGGGFDAFRGLGPEKIKEYIQLFGWGAKTNIDLPGEKEGQLPVFDENWRLGNTYHFSIGQGPFAITPIQVANAFVAVANGGTLYQPQILHQIIDSEKNIIETKDPIVVKEDFVDPGHLQTIRSGMRQTVTNGSALYWLNSLEVNSAAKTGTAQTGRKTADGRDILHTWTAAFAPYNDPELVFVVVVENAEEGETVALPVVREVFEWYFGERDPDLLVQDD